MNFSLVCFGVFSGFWDTERGEKQTFVWNVGAGGAGRAGSLWIQDLPECLRWSSCGVFLPFVRFTSLLLVLHSGGFPAETGQK